MSLHTEGELCQINEALAAAVRSVVGKRLDHVVSLQPSLLNSFLHHLHRFQTGHGVKVAVDPHNLGSYNKNICKHDRANIS